MTALAGVAVDQLDQIDGWDAENRTGETVVEAGDQRREVTAEGDAVQTDHRLGLLGADPGQQAPDIPHRLSGAVDVAEHVLTGERGALRQAPRTGAVHGKHGQHDVQAEIGVQMPGTK